MALTPVSLDRLSVLLLVLASAGTACSSARKSAEGTRSPVRYELEAKISLKDRSLEAIADLVVPSEGRPFIILSPHCDIRSFVDVDGGAVPIETASVQDDENGWPGRKLRVWGRQPFRGFYRVRYLCKSVADAQKKDSRSSFVITDTSFRLSEASQWYPTFPLGEEAVPSERGLGRLRLSCDDCASVYANGAPAGPPKSGEERGPNDREFIFAEAAEFHAWSFPGYRESVFRDGETELVFLPLNWTEADVGVVLQDVGTALEFYRGILGPVALPRRLYFSQIRANPARPGWMYTSWINAVFYSADEFNPGSLRRFDRPLAHELSHLWIDGHFQFPEVDGKQFLTESLAETLAWLYRMDHVPIEAQAEVDHLGLELAALSKAQPAPAPSPVPVSVFRATQEDPRYKDLIYRYAPYLLLRFRERIGPERFRRWFGSLREVSSDRMLTLSAFWRAAKAADITEVELKWIQSRLESPQFQP